MRHLSPGRLVPALLLLFFAATGCDTATSETDAPEVITPEAFELDLDLFDADVPDGLGAGKTSSSDYANFVNAKLRVGIVSAVVGANLVIPAAATEAALRTEPTIEDGFWTWNAAASAEGNEVRFALVGFPYGDGAESGVEWELRVTVPEHDALTDFALYSAETALDGSEGTWQLFYPIEGVRTNVLDAQFTVEADDDKQITFSVPAEAARNAGDSVRYERDGDERRFVWTQVEQNATTTVTWNPVTQVGQIVSPDYNNGEAACWDASLKNADCVAL